MFSRVTPMRMIRLCFKELRESLRDRRTIVTLVLMPLLVYPLLSLVLNRVLLTSVTTKANSVVTIGIANEIKDSQVPALLQLGYFLLNDREAAPTFIEPQVEEGKLRAKGASPLPRPNLLPLDGDGKAALRNNSADIIISGKAFVDDDDDTQAGPSMGTEAQQRSVLSLKQYQQMDLMQEMQFDLAKATELIGHLEIRYRKGDAASERALQMLERMLAAVNNEAARGLLGSEFEAPYRLYATPVVLKSNYADLLATMVPLVLVLMTMAGAVYPAIDLTAGERERGTMEALIVSPMPSYAILLAKYSAVVTVALLTALANLAAMTVTLWVSGIGKLVFGEGVLSTGVIGTVLILLVLFTMFFAALLLAVTSFAKSFKEAQAYLIPLMLLALTPGVMSLLPGIRFTNLLATVPLVNIVLLARDVLTNDAEWNTAMVAVICNGIYALAALAVASRLFGLDAAVSGSRGSWQDLFSRPMEARRYPATDQMALTMAVMFPAYFIASSGLPSVSDSLSTRLWIAAGVSFVLILILPLLVCLLRRVDIVSTFRMQTTSWRSWLAWVPAVLLIAGSAWMAAHEIFMAAQFVGIGTITSEHFERVADFRELLQGIPLWLVLFAFAFTPAVCEEFLFRGFVLSSLNKYSATWAVVLSSVMFGLMHVLTSNVLAVERFFPTTFMGLILGFIAIRTRSLWPGMLLHFLHNALLLTMSHYSDQLKEMKLFVEEGKEHLPQTWLIGGAVAFAAGVAIFWLASRRSPDTSFEDASQDVLPREGADGAVELQAGN